MQSHASDLLLVTIVSQSLPTMQSFVPVAMLPFNHARSSSPVYLLLLSFALHCSALRFPSVTIPDAYPDISDRCRQALDSRLDCDSTLVSISIDSLVPNPAQLASLCTPQCRQSLSDARKSVEDSCDASSDVIQHRGMTCPATLVMDQLTYAYDRSCLRDS
jgi:hypothetical protein